MHGRLSEDATIRASVLDLLLRALEADHGDVGALTARHGLSSPKLRDPYAQVQLSRYIAFFEDAAQIFADPLLGVRLGSMAEPKLLGPLGLLFSTAPTLRKAFGHLSRWISALQGATQVSLQERGDVVVWTYRIDDPTLWPRRQDAEYSLASCCALARAKMGSCWSPLEVHFEHSEPLDRATLETAFRTTLKFQQGTNRLLMARSDLNRPLRREDVDLTVYLQRHLEDLVPRRLQGPDIVERVRAIVASELGVERTTIGRVARDLGCSSRTLQRELLRQGSSLRRIIQDHRQAIVNMRAREPGLSNSALAHALGYADETVFWRAFKSWTGSSPSQYRRTNDL